MTKATLDIKEWADQKSNEYRETIKKYIAQGIEKKAAVNMALDGSTLGQGYLGQIRYEFR